MKLFVFLSLLAVAFGHLQPRNEVKVVGGTPAYPGEFPYTVSIRAESFGHICGGAIVSPNLIVTAAACTDPRSPEIVGIFAGTLFRNESFPGEQVRLPARVVNHPEYDGMYMHNDLALIFLDQPFVFNQYISNISLPGRNQFPIRPDQIVLNGWGAEQYGQPLADFLLKVTLRTYTDEECEAWMEQPVRPEILCTGRDEEGYGGCIGDAGTPLVANAGTERQYLAAVSSHFPCQIGAECCGIPGPTEMSPELTYYLDWILEQSRIYGGGLE